ncbi:MAG: UxaA family hydrolase, partial [Oscillospiraceae bacterium]|nr:UxaA family hydrolase [Oscillospiraceae bacterium]
MKVIRITDNDNVAVALTAITAGDIVTAGDITVTALEDIPAGHKICIFPIAKDSDVIKYGSRIGLAQTDIAAGEWVHTHNIRTGLSGIVEYTYSPIPCTLEKEKAGSFMGYERPDGSVGVRNEIWIIPTVGCVNGIVRTLEKRAARLIDGTLEDIIG